MTFTESINYLTLIPFSFVQRTEKSCKHTPGIKYEHKVAQWLKKHGYRNVHVTPASGDYGVDITARKGRIRYAIQCKSYSRPVGVSAVQEVYSGIRHYNCDRAMVVTNSTFTAAAKTLARENNVILVENIKL